MCEKKQHHYIYFFAIPHFCIEMNKEEEQDDLLYLQWRMEVWHGGGCSCLRAFLFDRVSVRHRKHFKHISEWQSQIQNHVLSRPPAGESFWMTQKEPKERYRRRKRKTGRPRAICCQQYPLSCFAWLWIGVRGRRAAGPKGTKSSRTQGKSVRPYIRQ